MPLCRHGLRNRRRAGCSPHYALHAHLELADIPIIDKATLTVLGNDDYLLSLLRAQESAAAIEDYVAWTLEMSRGLGIKVVNAGGAAAFKENVRAFSFDDVVPSYGVSSRAIVKALQHAVNALGVPHPLHVHCNNLGLAANAATALTTVAAAEELPLHLAHLQFYGYGKEGERGFSSAAAPLAAAVNATHGVTIDVGQVMFGQTVTVSSDVLRQFNARHQARPKKWLILDGDANGGGIVPYNYRRSDFYNAVQWAVGLELFLLIDDPWRVFFTTDHPNGAHFATYPEIFALLMSRDLRAQWIAELPPAAMAVTTLPSISREYSLVEIATMTRAAPARLLGLTDRGHLNAGAVADVAVYENDDDRAKMFRAAALVFKDGELVVRNGSVIHCRWGRALTVKPERDQGDRSSHASLLRRSLRARGRVSEGSRAGARAARTVRTGVMRVLTVKGVRIDNTFAEAFGMRATAVTITADTARWARQAALTMTGFATSVIGCGCEAGIDRELTAKETPDGRPGIRVPAVWRFNHRTAKAAAGARGAVRADEPGLGLLRWHRGRGDAAARQCTEIFWRRLADLKAIRRETLLAHSGHGRRIRLRSDNGPDEKCGRWRQPHHYWPQFENDACRGGSGGGGNCRCAGRDRSVSWRDRSVGVQSRFEVQERAGFDQRRLLPDAAGRGEHFARPRIKLGS